MAPYLVYNGLEVNLCIGKAGIGGATIGAVGPFDVDRFIGKFEHDVRIVLHFRMLRNDVPHVKAGTADSYRPPLFPDKELPLGHTPGGRITTYIPLDTKYSAIGTNSSSRYLRKRVSEKRSCPSYRTNGFEVSSLQ